MPLDPRSAILAALGAYLVPGRPYPRPLPAELAPWHCYTVA